MTLKKMILLATVAITVSACGNIEWFPEVQDTTAPTITATVAGKTIFNNSTTHVSSLPASVVFSANEAATIYYTTNGETPTESSASVSISASNTTTDGPIISITNTVLKFFGIDQATTPNKSSVITSTIKSP